MSKLNATQKAALDYLIEATEEHEFGRAIEEVGHLGEILDKLRKEVAKVRINIDEHLLDHMIDERNKEFTGNDWINDNE